MSKTVAKGSHLKQALELQETTPDPRIRRKFRTSLTVKNKLEVIEYANQNPNATQSKIASHFGIDRTTVSKVLKKRIDILAYADKFSDSNDLAMSSTLMKKESPSPENGDSGLRKASSPNEENKVNPAKTRSRLVLPKRTAMDHVKMDERILKSKDQVGVYHPELLSKCESWFMDQKLSKGSEHITSIRAFSKLISIIPLSDALCYKILAGKVVRDACLSWIKDTLLKSPQDLGKNLASRSFELLHRFILEEFSSIDLESYFCDGFTTFEADDVKRIWVKYIQPKLGLFNIVATAADTSVLQTNGKTVWKLQTTEASLNALGNNYKSNSPFHTPQPDEISQPNSPSMSPKGTDAVKGSRKRKMNSRPVRMVNVDVDGDAEPNTVSDPLRSLLLQPIENQLPASHSIKIRKTEDITVRNTQSPLNGKVHSVIAPVGIIEIKPDDCSDEENGQNGFQIYESHETSHTNNHRSPHHQEVGKRVSESGFSSASVPSGKMISSAPLSGNVNTSAVVNRICTEHAKKVIEGISANISQVVKATADNNKPKCDCDCAGLKTKVEAMEKQLESMQNMLCKIYAATCSSDNTKDNNNE